MQYNTAYGQPAELLGMEGAPAAINQSIKSYVLHPQDPHLSVSHSIKKKNNFGHE